MVVLEVNDLTKVYGSSDPLRAKLSNNGSPIVNADVVFNINGRNYTRVTDNTGYASLNINLPIGVYPCRVQYQEVFKTVSVRVTDKKAPWLIARNLNKTYGTTDPLRVGLFDGATPLGGRTIEYTINGVKYNRTTGADGYASLNINLRPGTYNCSVRNIPDAVYGQVSSTVTVTVKADTWIDAANTVKKYSEKGYFQCAVYDQWERLNPCKAQITINGRTYTRETDNTGLIKLNINLPPGTYTARVDFAGDSKHNPAPTAYANVVVKPDIEEVTYLNPTSLVSTPENLRGHMQTRIFHRQQTGWVQDIDKHLKNAPSYVIFGSSANSWELSQINGWEINFTSYEIDETDPRVKTATVTTNHYFDLTNGMVHLHIVSPVHENFTGQILDVDYDKKTKLYKYKLQDGRRQYQSKRILRIMQDSSKTVYDVLRDLLLAPALYGYGKEAPSRDEVAKLHPELLSGLHPIGAYDNLKSSAIKFSNMFKQPARQLLSYDSDMDKIMNLAHTGQFPTDVYFDTNQVCHIDPVDLDKWLNTGIRIRHSDLVEYKKSFDTTNIITGVNIKDPNTASHNYYEDWKQLRFYFGANISMVDPVTITTKNNNTSNNSGSGGSNDPNGLMSGKKTFAVGCDNINGGEHNLINKVISALKNKGHNAYSLGVGPNVNQSHGETSRAKGVINIFIVGGICAGTVKDYAWGIGRNYKYDHMIMMFANCTTDNWISCNALKNKKQVRAHDDGFSSGIDTSITPHQMFEKNRNKISYIAGQPNEGFDSLVNKLVNGQFNCGSGGSSNNNSEGSSAGDTAGTTVIDATATYNKALEDVSKSIRSLLTFEIKIPLNSPVFKNLHTNMMLWTELPVDFKLANLEKVFKIMPVYKVSRGISSDYRVNRWYVEGVKIKGDSNGVFATIKLNPFPSSYSVYSNAVKEYAKAYDQAFNQKKEESNNNNNNNSGGVGEPRLGRDSRDTGDMACATGRRRGRAGDNENFDNCAKKGYAQQGRKYYDWARQYKTPIELAKALANRFKYEGYYNHHDSNAEVTHANGGTIYCNCWDAARYVKCCFDSCGFDCVVITGSIYQGGHGWNAVKHNGRWYTFDLCYRDTGREWPGTNTLRLCNEW